MAISHVASAQAYGTSVTVVPLTHGFAFQDGDVVVAFVHASTQVACTNLEGVFPNVRTAVGSPAVSYCWVFSKYIAVAASEPATYYWTLGSTSVSVILQQFRGCDRTIWDVRPSADSAVSGTGTSCVSAPMTVLTNGAMGLVYIAAESATLPLINNGVDNSYGNLYEITAGRDSHAYRCASLSPGAVGVTTCSLGTSDDWAMHHVALKPDSGAAAATTMAGVFGRAANAGCPSPLIRGHDQLRNWIG